MAGRNEDTLEHLSLLGNQQTKYKFEYDPDILEPIDNL
ncbi:MAG: NADPH-dependent 7-cyano-7-deazaguanine reductase QueF, partial [Planococcus sp. (in: Bacteria)]|nr:NADPH-dependent 7-cyano-7-deazaguanine reductase QueF [Planococcus sp. (in: firmicutes)]